MPQNKSRSFLDLLPEGERDQALKRAERRLERLRLKKGLDVSPEIYITSEMGSYFGWEGLMAIRRGYTIDPDIDKDGNLFYTKSVLTLAEVSVFLEGARKVGHSKLIDRSHGTFVATASAFSKNPGQSFNKGMEPYAEKAKVEE